MENPFNIYTSKVKRFNIPLPEFEHHHKSSSEEQVDKKYIGRKKISDRLYNWLIDEKTGSGSYLVTGYRGMGKSSFVGRILYEVSGRVGVKGYTFGFIVFLILWGSLFYTLCNYQTLGDEKYIFAIVGVCLTSLFVMYHKFKLENAYKIFRFRGQVFHYLWKRIIKEKKGWSALRASFVGGKGWNKNWKKIIYELYNADTRKKSYSRISISINLGREVLNEKDILCLITNELYIKYRYYVHSPIANCTHWLVKTCFVFGLAFMLLIVFHKAHILGVEDFNFTGREYTILYAFGNFYGSVSPQLMNSFIFSLFLFVSYFIYNRVISRFLFTQKRILSKLRFLNERLDASVDNEMGIKAKSSLISFNLNKRKVYPLANVREIEQELIDILNRINQGFFSSPSFIFVFDELDKIEAETSGESVGSHPVPEYTNEKNFPGGGTSRKRKQNVLRLLANMKLFVSTAKAKFIFISGRELYDAYLADLSDREFAISSVFNGIIYVESFCTNENKEKDIMSNAETYICRQLIPKSFILEECVEHYLDGIKENKGFDKIDIDLKLYYKFLIKEYEKMAAHQKSREVFSSLVQECPLSNEKTIISASQEKDRQVRVCIDKAILLLYHFSVYLYHISNGSPKKMTLYFEKFVKQTLSQPSFQWRKKTGRGQKQMLEGKDINIRIFQKSKYHLSFGYLDQRKIGFIHYISYPVTQAIINANQFGDKLLVSASFLIDHIYKFHNSGFSWRNLEHTPELLEVYRIPEFRGFISSIISYLTQTHIIPITCGLYQFKFRKQFSEEISLASKFSEEIAALFNFTLDESLSVKRHYNELQEHFNRKMNEEKTDIARVKTGLHHILADLYMSDEEYTNAIFEYQMAIQLADPKHATDKDLDDPHYISQILSLIRNMLKLGLAYEKRKTYESAYVTYSELIGRLIRFRYLPEKDFGLDYLIEKMDEWPMHKAVLYAGKQTKYRNEREEKVTQRVCPQIISDSKINISRYSLYRTNGPDILTDFAHQMTVEKSSIIQRLSLLEDVRLIYQALLAKLFVLEKIELGGITRANLELLESEYVFLHLATNEKDKFLISTDFFRRLGDVMYYKNGLAGQNIDSFMEGLYYWAYNVKTEILDFCNEYNCYYLREALVDFMEEAFKNESIQSWQRGGRMPFEVLFPKAYAALLSKLPGGNDETEVREIVEKFFKLFCKKMKSIPLHEVNSCNRNRRKKWKEGKPLPCYACKYYNRSLHILMKNLFCIDIEKQCAATGCSKTIIILELLIQGGSSKSLRQNFMIQLAEILDCMGNVMLSCADDEATIDKVFLEAFLQDVYALNISPDNPNKEISHLSQIYKKNAVMLSKLERAMLYYWEASECFRIGDDFKKASDSLKKILRVIQNYLKVKRNVHGNRAILNEKEVVGEFLNEIKNRIVKKSLLYLYSHYNYINITEIQKLKWVFTVQMYENISLNRLSLFPDVEEIMLIYYEMIQLCLLSESDREIKVLPNRKDVSWQTASARNRDFRLRLATIYHNMAFTTARMESTIYERVLSMRFRAMLNQEILHHLVRGCRVRLRYYENAFLDSFIRFLKKYLDSKLSLAESLGEYRRCFPEITLEDETQSNHCRMRFWLLEFLIKDSMYCLTKILEMITPYTSTTLFTNTFLGEIHQRLFEWNQLFDALYMLYKVVDKAAEEERKKKDEANVREGTEDEKMWIVDKMPSIPFHKACPYLEKKVYEGLTKEVSKCWSSQCPYPEVCRYKQSPFEKMRLRLRGEKELGAHLEAYAKVFKGNLAYRFFTDILKDMGKSNIHYTLNNYSAEMAIKCYRRAFEMHKEGKAYKEMISKMYYLDDDLKNDTIQFDSAIERYKINNNYIYERIEMILQSFKTSSIYNIESFTTDQEVDLPLAGRFDEKEYHDL